VRFLLVLLAVATVAAVSSCSGDSQTYSVEETKEAFDRHGYVLVTPSVPQVSNLPEGVLAPKDHQVFFVFVGTDAEADEAWPDYERLQDENSFDVRRTNVVIIADDGPPSADREKVLAALASLPDRGSPVDIAGD